jgi:hypothetical protein
MYSENLIIVQNNNRNYQVDDNFNQEINSIEDLNTPKICIIL